MSNLKEKVEEIVDSCSPCICGFTQGFAYKYSKCDCANSEAKEELIALFESEMMEGEEWRPIREYQGYYEVSSNGRARSLSRYTKSRHGEKLSKGRMLKPQLLKLGYIRYDLSKNGTSRHHSAHRLVAAAFVKPVKGKPNVNHIDGDKTNNVVENLEWCTSKENSQHAYNTGLVEVALGADSSNGKKTHCPKGHPYSGSNLFPIERVEGRIHRDCRECRRAAVQKWRQSQRKLMKERLR